MAINNRLGVGIPAVAVVAGVLSGALLRTPGNTEAQNRAEGGRPPEPQASAVAAAAGSSLVDLRPVIELLGQSLGVPTSRNEVLRATRALERSLQAKDDATRLALEALRSKWGLEEGQSDDALKTEGAARVVDGYLRSEVDPAARLHALQLKIADTFLDDAADERDLALLKAGARNNDYTVEFLIATIPDYVDSNSAWRADQVLGAVQSAMGYAGYALDRFRLIDWSRADAKSEAQITNDSRLHEKQPGALIFRRVLHDHETLQVTFQVVLLVLETPTGGIHRPAMLNALKLVNRWDKSFAVKVIGPGFSGSTFSLARALKDSLKDPTESSRIAIVSGSATADENPCIVKQLLPEASYRTTVQTTYRSLSALQATVTSLNPSWTDGANTALLIESNTTYGNDADRSEDSTDQGGLEARPFCDQRPAALPFENAFVFRFPLHVAELRADSQAVPSPTLSLVPASAVPLRLRETTPPADQIPELRPGMDGPIVESQVNSIIDVIRHRRLTLVGIVATDERDVLFLAKMVKRDVPDVQLFWIGANLIYLHSDYAPYTRGALVASNYPLYVADQRRQDEPGQPGKTKRREAFQSSAAEGVFNATLVQLGERDKLVDYCTAGNDGGGACAPPVWVSVIGDDGFWPLTHESFDGFKPRTHEQPAKATSQSEAYPYPLYSADHAASASPSLPLPTPTRVLAIAIIGFVGIHLWVAMRLWRAGGSQADLALNCWSLMRVFAPPVTYPSAAAAHAKARTLCFVLLCCLLAWPLGLLYLHVFGATHSPWTLGGLALVLLPMLASVARLAPPAVTAPLVGLEAAPKASDESTQLGWWNGALTYTLLPLFVGMLLMFIWFELELVFVSRDGTEKMHQLARFVGGGIVSPAASVICVFAAMYVAMYSGLRRLALVGRGFVGLTRSSSAFRRLAGPALHDAEQVTSHDMQDQLGPLLDMPVQYLPAPYAAVLFVSLIACAAALDPGAWSLRGWPAPPITTVDGRVFSWFLVSATATALAAALLLVAQAMAAWQKLRRGLERVARLCIAPAFDVISEHARWDLSLTPPRVKDLVPLVSLANRFLGAARRGDVFDLSDVTRAQRFDPPAEADGDASLLQSSLAFSLWRLSDQVLQRLEEVRWTAPADGQLAPLAGRRQSDEPSAEKQCQMGAVVVALQYAFVVRDILARMMSSLFAAMLCLTLLTCAHLFYVFQGRSSLLTIDLLAVAITAIGAMWVLVGMERDGVLSRLRHSTPGQIDFSWGFVQRIAIYGLLPLVAVIGALFPEVAGPVLGWLDPLKKLITF